MTRGKSGRTKVDTPGIPAGMAECNICGQRMPANQEAMLSHVVLKHPYDMLTSKSFTEPLINWAFNLGMNLAGKFR